MFAGLGSRNKPLKNEDYSGGGIITKAQRCREKIPAQERNDNVPFSLVDSHRLFALSSL
jgi:hypothetical protein